MQPHLADFLILADNLPVMIWVTDKEGVCTFLNKRWLEFTGQSLEEGQGMGWSNALHPDDKEIATHYFFETSQKQQPFEIEYRLRKLDGSYEWVLDSSVPYFDPDGNFLGYIGSVTNIHKRKIADESIRASEERFRNLADQAPIWVWMADENMNNTYANKELLSFLGLSHYSQLAAMGWQAFIHPDDIQRANESLFKAAKEHKAGTTEFRVKNASTGKYVWFLNKEVPLFEHNRFKGFIGTAVSIEEQKKQMEILAESEMRFRSLAETLPQLVWMSDEKGRQLFVSARWEEYTGIKPITTDKWGAFVHPDDQQAMQQAWQDSLKTDISFQTEARLKNKEGEYRWHHLQGVPVRNEKGEITRWVGSLTDIHDQKTLSKRLEELVRKRTKELQRSNEDLKQFAHVASHDLKEPVRKIKTFTNRLQEEIGDQLNENAKFYINRILNAANRMGVMIDGVLSYSTLSALGEVFEDVNLNDVIETVEVDLELVIHQKEASIRYRDLPTIEGAPILLHQLFYNLVNNALKFSRPGVAPVITLTSRIECQANGQECAQVIVQDNGIGFEQEHADQIFGTFVRLNSKDKFEGSGLGLALCKNIVDRHGGSIKAKGTPNVGASFLISLPVKR